MANENPAEGRMRDMADQARQAFGMMSEDENREMTAPRRRLRSRARHLYGEARHTVEDATRVVGRRISDQPLPAMLIAGALGFALGVLLFRRDESDMRWSARRRAL